DLAGHLVGAERLSRHVDVEGGGAELLRGGEEALRVVGADVALAQDREHLTGTDLAQFKLRAEQRDRVCTCTHDSLRERSIVDSRKIRRLVALPRGARRG